MKDRTQNLPTGQAGTEHRTQIRHQRLKIKIQKYGIVFLVAFLLITHNSLLITAVSAAEWRGVDESVVEKYAEEHGRAARDPFINTDQGDLLLFVFLLAGAVGGFVGGYYWRQLTERRQSTPVPDGKSGEDRACLPDRQAQTGKRQKNI